MKKLLFLLAFVVFTGIFSSCTEEAVEPDLGNNVKTESNDGKF